MTKTVAQKLYTGGSRIAEQKIQCIYMMRALQRRALVFCSFVTFIHKIFVLNEACSILTTMAMPKWRLCVKKRQATQTNCTHLDDRF